MIKRGLHWLLCFAMMLAMMIGIAVNVNAATKTVTWGSDFLTGIRCFQLPEGSANANNSYGGIKAVWSGGQGYLRKYDTGSGAEVELFMAEPQCNLTFSSTVGKIKKIEIVCAEATLLRSHNGWNTSADYSVVTWSGTPAASVNLTSKGLSIADEGAPYIIMYSIEKIIFTVEVPVTGVSLNKTSTALTVGDKETLTATVAPTSAENKNVTWSSSNAGIASVDSNGTITAVSPGTATIIVKTNDGGKTAACTVTVNRKVISVTGVSLKKTSTTLTVGDKETLTATVAPGNADNKNVTWSSDNAGIASVDSNGTITAVSPGTATIIVKTNDGGKTAACTVTVNRKVISVTGVSLDNTLTTLTVGDTKTLTATVAPDNADNKNVTWSSDNAGIASVDSNGTITAVSPGTAAITVTTEDGRKTAACTVTVNRVVISVTGVSLNKTSTQLTVGDKETLTATVAPGNADNKKVSWSSGDKSIASVDSNGKITAAAPGTAIITVTTKEGSKTAACLVNVTGDDKLVQMNKVVHKTNMLVLKWSTIAGAEGYDLYAAFCGRDLPSQPTMTVAGTKCTLTKAYNLTGNSRITAGCIKYRIKAYRMENGKKNYISKTRVCHTIGPNSNLYSDTEKIRTNRSKFTLRVGRTAKLNATSLNNGKKNKIVHGKKFQFASSNKSVATVTSKGNIKAVGVGTCNIYVIAPNGLTKTVKVTVKGKKKKK